MGNHKFRLSNMIPNAWFYKLKQMATNPTIQKHSPPPILTTKTTKPDHAPEEAGHHPRKSYYFTRNLNSKTPNSPDFFHTTPLDPPRKSSRRRRRRRRRTNSSTPNPSSTPTTTKYSSSSSLSAGCSCRATATATVQSFRPKPGSSSHQDSSSSSTTITSSSVDQLCLLPQFSIPNHVLPSKSFDRMVAWSSTSYHSPVTEDDHIHNDVVICRRKTAAETVSRIGLPPIRTEHKKFSDLVKEIGGTQEEEPIKQRKSSVSVKNRVKAAKEESSSMASCVFKEQGSSPVRRISTGSPRGIRIRINSPRLSRRVQVGIEERKRCSNWRRNWKSISSESLAVVKSSSDPQRDFRESMVEMILENNLRASKELEDLLACYLSLNSMEYHHVIIQVFKQIWFDLNDISRGS